MNFADRSLKVAQLLLEAFRGCDSADERNTWLRLRNKAERELLFGLWAEECSLTQLMSLEGTYQRELITFFVGDAQRGINAVGRVFQLRAVQDVAIELRSMNNRAQYAKIAKDRVVTWPFDKAYLALSLYGPDASIPLMRGKVEEVIPEPEPEAEVGQITPIEAPAKKKGQ